MGYGTMLFQYLTERKRAKTQQTQWEREQQLREQFQTMQKEQFGLEKQKSEQETARWSPGGMTKPEPFLGPYGPVKMTPQEIPEGPEYMRSRVQAELARKQLEYARTPEEMAQLESDIRTAEEGRRAGAAEEASVLAQQAREREATTTFGRERETAKTGHGYRMEEIAAGMKPPKEAEEPLIKPDGSINQNIFYDAVVEKYPKGTFFDFVDKGQIRTARDSLLRMIKLKYAKTPEQAIQIETAFDQWLGMMEKMSSQLPEEKKRKVNWYEFASLFTSPIRARGKLPKQSEAETPSTIRFPREEGGYNLAEDISTLFGVQISPEIFASDPVWRYLITGKQVNPIVPPGAAFAAGAPPVQKIAGPPPGAYPVGTMPEKLQEKESLLQRVGKKAKKGFQKTREFIGF